MSSYFNGKLSTSSLLERRTRAAKFELDARLENFDFTADPGIPAARIRDLANAEWVKAGQHLVVSGPSALERRTWPPSWATKPSGQGTPSALTSRVLADLAGGHADGSRGKRLRAYTKPDLLILDDFAMREFTPAQGDDIYEIVRDRASRSIIVTTNRDPKDWYPLFPNAVVAESLFDRLVNNAHHLPINAPPTADDDAPGPPANMTPDTREFHGEPRTELRGERHCGRSASCVRHAAEGSPQPGEAAAGLMVAGIAVPGVVTASIESWLVESVSAHTAAKTAERTAAALDAIDEPPEQQIRAPVRAGRPAHGRTRNARPSSR